MLSLDELNWPSALGCLSKLYTTMPSKRISAVWAQFFCPLRLGGRCKLDLAVSLGCTSSKLRLNNHCYFKYIICMCLSLLQMWRIKKHFSPYQSNTRAYRPLDLRVSAVAGCSVNSLWIVACEGAPPLIMKVMKILRIIFKNIKSHFKTAVAHCIFLE